MTYNEHLTIMQFIEAFQVPLVFLSVFAVVVIALHLYFQQQQQHAASKQW